MMLRGKRHGLHSLLPAGPFHFVAERSDCTASDQDISQDQAFVR